MYMMNVSMARRSPCPRMHGTPSPTSPKALVDAGKFASIKAAKKAIASRKAVIARGGNPRPFSDYAKTTGRLKKSAK
jgi:hypothetical protein